MLRLRKIMALVFMVCAMALAVTATASAGTTAPGNATASGGATATATHYIYPPTASARSALVSPAIEQESCTSARSTWVHVYLTNGGTTCFGFAGETGYLSLDAYSMDPGNNYGWLTYNYGYEEWDNECFGTWPSGDICEGGDYSCNVCGGFDWDYSPYYYAVVNYVWIDGWT
jgi:hypothetical protein